MVEQFPYIGHHFGVFFLFPKFNFNGNFSSVTGLSFGSKGPTLREGGLVGYSHTLTDNGTFPDLTLERGFTDNDFLYEWCEKTHNTMKADPCNILISLLNKQNLPVKNWLVFNAIPKNWESGNLTAENSQVMMEKVTFSYQNFILI